MTDPNPDSILDSVKKALGLAVDYTAFDLDVIMHINTSFSVLNDLGVGPVDGFVITDNTALWTDYSSEMILLPSAKSYMYLKVKLLFDPPPTSFSIEAVEAQLREMEFRLNVIGEKISPPSDPTNPDGGSSTVSQAYWWDLTGLSDFPSEAAIGDLGIDMASGDVWRKET